MFLSKIRIMNDVFETRNLITLNYLACIISNPDSMEVKSQSLSKKNLIINVKTC